MYKTSATIRIFMSPCGDPVGVSIGCVSAVMSVSTLEALASSYADIEKHISDDPLPDSCPMVVAKQIDESLRVSYFPDRQTYSIRLRGVIWEVASEDLSAFINEDAIPFFSVLAHDKPAGISV